MQIPVEKLFQNDAKFEMAPMIDMVFLLLVFFMCASHLSVVQNVELEIPTATKAVVPEDRSERFIVNITSNVTIYDGCLIGNSVIIHANTVLGADAFYYKNRSEGFDN